MRADPLLLPEERVLWEGSPRARPLGPLLFDAALGGGCLAVISLGVLFAMIGTAGAILQSGPRRELVELQFGETFFFIVMLVFGWSFAKGLRRDARARRAHRTSRYLITTRRAIVQGPDPADERLIELETLAASPCRTRGHDVLLLDAAGAEVAAFAAVGGEGVPAIERAIMAGRSERPAS